MHDDTAILLEDVGKCYRVFPNRLDYALDAFGALRFLPWRGRDGRDFWALKQIDMEVGRGQRVGIIGCNGAGKTTLLKLVVGNVHPTEGNIAVQGTIRALMSTGAGFHPEFTGRENIVASLTHQDMTRREVAEAMDDIADFTELEAFLDQPFRTYSAGMQARLTFATATCIRPDILIIDEVLGAGDGYFIAKSTERMERLVKDSASTILLVSHDLVTTQRMCDRVIWLDRGQVRQAGDALEVIKAYQRYLRKRTERRIRERNRLRSTGRRSAAELDIAATTLSVGLQRDADGSGACRVARVALEIDGVEHDEIIVGHAQDSSPFLESRLIDSDGSPWSAPRQHEGRACRTIEGSHESGTRSSALFTLHGMHPNASYELVLEANAEAGSTLVVRADVGGKETPIQRNLELQGGRWETVRVPIIFHEEPDEKAGVSSTRSLETAPERPSKLSTWGGTADLDLSSVRLHGTDGLERGIYEPRETLEIDVEVVSQMDGEVPLWLVVVLYRRDGVLVTRSHREVGTSRWKAGERRTFSAVLPELNLGNGHYVLSVGLMRNMQQGTTETHAIHDRSYEFEVQGNPWHAHGIFTHPVIWRVEAPLDESISPAGAETARI